MPRSAEPRPHARPKNPDSSSAVRELPAMGAHHVRRHRSHPWIRRMGMVLVAVLSFTGTFASAMYVQSTENITTADIGAHITPLAVAETPKDPDDQYAGQALNILVMGTDYRDAENIEIAGEDSGGGMRADTTFLVHLSGDRSYVEIISFPRDTLVPIPACDRADGSKSKATKSAMFNSAFSTGAQGAPDPDKAIEFAAACTGNTVQQLTGVALTNFLVLKMTGVVGVVDALGGVTMCFDERVVGSKKYSPDLDIPAGQQTLDGLTSIEFVRARHGKGMGLEQGSDLTRIQRQQAFIDSLLTEILSSNILSDTPKLYGMLQEILKSMTVDPKLGDLRTDLGLAFSLKNVSSSRIVFTPLPVAEAPSDKDRVVFADESKVIWARIAGNQPPESLAPPAATPDPGAGSTPAGTPPGAPPNAGAGTAPNAGAGAAQNGGAAPNAGAAPATDAGANVGATPALPDTSEHLPGVCYDGWTPRP